METLKRDSEVLFRMYCIECGTEMSDDAIACPDCGRPTRNVSGSISEGGDTNLGDSASKGGGILPAILSFLVPGLGQFYNRDSRKGAYIIIPAVLISISMGMSPVSFVLGLIIYIPLWGYATYEAYHGANS